MTKQVDELMRLAWQFRTAGRREEDDCAYQLKHALEAALKPGVEPVAWRYQPNDSIKSPAFTTYENVAIGYGKEGSIVPLFAHPPRREPLSDEQMHHCAQAMDAEPLAEVWRELIKFARAIEQAHGITGGVE